MTSWKYRIYIIAPVAATALLNALWTVIAPEGDSEARTFGMPLSPSGQEPPTHTGVTTAATEEMRILIQEIFPDDLLECVLRVQDAEVNNWQAFLSVNHLQEIQTELAL